MKKRKILSLLFGGLLLPGLLSAKPVAIDFSERTPANSAVRSLLLPGWGQAFNSQGTKGYLIGGAAAVGVITSYLLYTKANKTYDDYAAKGVKNDALYSDYESQSSQAMYASLLTAGVWVYGVVDAYLNGTAPEAVSLNKEGLRFDGRHEFGLAYSKRF